MVIRAGQIPNTIASTDIRYREGRPEIRQYDFCYYEIINENYKFWDDKNGTDVLEDRLITFELLKSTEMNVHIYEGRRGNASHYSLVENDMPPAINQKIQVKYGSSLLVIAYPNKDMDTEFMFTYSLKRPQKEEEEEPELPELTPAPSISIDTQNTIIIAACGGALLLIVCCFIYYICQKRKNNKLTPE